MDQTLTDAQKRKRPPSRQPGCLKLLLIPLLLGVACYGGMWVFARYGGEWAMSDQILIPPESQLLLTKYEDGWVTMKTRLYTHLWSPKVLKEWFGQHGTPVLPIYAQREEEDPDNDYYFRSGIRLTSNQMLFSNSVSLTSDWKRDERSQGTHMCGGLVLYKTEEAFHRDYPDWPLPSGVTAFQVRICWPNVK
jgi:hypothetical protein